MRRSLDVQAGFSGGISFFYDNMQVVIRCNPERCDNDYFKYSWYAVTPERIEGTALISGIIDKPDLEDSILRERIAIGLLKHFIRNKKGYDGKQKIEIEPSEIRREKRVA